MSAVLLVVVVLLIIFLVLSLTVWRSSGIPVVNITCENSSRHTQTISRPTQQVLIKWNLGTCNSLSDIYIYPDSVPNGIAVYTNGNPAIDQSATNGNDMFFQGRPIYQQSGSQVATFQQPTSAFDYAFNWD